MDKTKPKIVQKGPMVADLKPGDYYWCSCGRSKNQPYCDGTHKTEAEGLRSKRVVIEKDMKVYWCACKHTKNPPFCDGTHNTL